MDVAILYSVYRGIEKLASRAPAAVNREYGFNDAGWNGAPARQWNVPERDLKYPRNFANFFPPAACAACPGTVHSMSAGDGHLAQSWTTFCGGGLRNFSLSNDVIQG
jgi:hypothetical protein